MSTSRVKICGLTTPEAAQRCAELGADYLGVIFADSPRQVTVEQARLIRVAVPDARLVGVFVDAELGTVASIASGVRLDLIQLHGQETPEYCAVLQERTGLPLIKVMTVDSTAESPIAQQLADYSAVDYFLFDLAKGQDTDPEAIEELLVMASASARLSYRILVAGALTPRSVAAVVNRTQPFGVDVCSGVESNPGTKDFKLVKRFIVEVHSA